MTPRKQPTPISATHRPAPSLAMGFSLSLLLVAMMASYANPAAAAPAGNSVRAAPKTTASPGWARGRLLVAPRAGLSTQEFDKTLKAHGARSKGLLKKINTHIIELPAGADEVAMMLELRKNRKFKFVELDTAMSATATVNDPNFSSSWALPKIQTPTAWDSANGAGIIIAILDSGMDSSHPDLAANVVPGWNFYDNNSNTTETNGHGTWVAGVTAMAGNNSKGSAGVAFGAKLMPVRIASPDGYAYASTMAQAITWAADNGARVANISYSGVPGNSTVQSAAQYMRDKGGVVVASAGNSGALENIAANDTILAVSATDQNDVLASFSSYGPYVDLAAPGVSLYSTAVGGGFGYYSGTSFSSPVVAATAALMMSANPKLTPVDIDKILKSTALDLGAAGVDQYFGSGRIDAAKAVATAKTYVASDTQLPTISITAPTAGSKVVGIVPVDAKYSDNIGVTKVEFFVNGSKLVTDTVSPFAFSWDTAAHADGAASLTVKAYDAAGNIGSSASVSVTIGNDVTPPVITSLNPANGATVTAKLAVKASATDNQSVAKTSLTIDGKEVAISYGGAVSYSWNTNKAAKGAHSIVVRAWDKANNTSSKTITVYK